jgi:long-subunit fatty acid transport protein
VLILPFQAFTLPTPSDFQIPSSYQPLGSGARAIGMGGAFIGIADDATAASWNPGGLVQLEKSEISIVGSFFRRNEDLESNTFMQFEKQPINYEGFNFLSLSHCFTFLQRNMVVSLNYQNLYDFDRKWSLPIPHKSETPGLQTEINVDFVSKGNLSAVGFAYSIEIHPKFSMGLTLNWWDNDLTRNFWETDTNYSLKMNTDNSESRTCYLSKYEYQLDQGFNTNIGFLWQITPSITLGGVYKARFTSALTMKYIRTVRNNYKITTDKYTEEKNTVDFYPGEEECKLAIPESYGLGLAVKLTNLWSVSFDVYRTQWDEFIIKTDQGKYSPLFALPSTDDFSYNDIPTIKPTHQIRVGSEYLYLNKAQQMVIPFRWGIFYDPVPGKGSPDKSWGFSLGSGVSKSPYNFDIAFQYRHASNLGEDYQYGHIKSFDLSETILYTSFIYHF